MLVAKSPCAGSFGRSSSTSAPAMSDTRAARRWTAFKASATPVVSWGRGRRGPGATTQHPPRPGADGRRLRELRQRHLLRVRVHAHVRARRPRDGRRRHPRCRRVARQHVTAVLPGAARGDAGLVLEVVDAGGNPEPSGGAAARRRELGRGVQAPPGFCLFDPRECARVILEEDVYPARGIRVLQVHLRTKSLNSARPAPGSRVALRH